MSKPFDHPQPPPPDAPQRARRIIICDDDLDLALILAEHLHLCGCMTQVRGSARAVLRLIAEEPSPPVELVITDLCTPGLDGCGLIAALRIRYPGIRTALMTAHVKEHSAAIAAIGGVVLHKPFSLVEIERLVGIPSAAGGAARMPRRGGSGPTAFRKQTPHPNTAHRRNLP